MEGRKKRVWATTKRQKEKRETQYQKGVIR